MEFTAANNINGSPPLRTNKSAPTSMTNDSKTTTQQSSEQVCFLCSICGKSFGSRKALAGHQKAHTGQIRWSSSVLPSPPSASAYSVNHHHRNSSSANNNMIPCSSSGGGGGFVKPGLGVRRDLMIHKHQPSLIRSPQQQQQRMMIPPPYLWKDIQMQYYWRWQQPSINFVMRNNNPKPMAAVVQPNNINIPVVHPGAINGSCDVRNLAYKEQQQQQQEEHELDLTLKL